MFDTLIPDAQTFVRALARDNTRDWFLAHKADYDAKLRAPALALLDALTPKLAKLSDCKVTPKLFRANRDVRFSKDKTPYKTHLHMMWTIETGTRQNPVMFFGVDPDSVTVGTGMMEFSKEVLTDWRKMVDLDGAYIAQKLKLVTDKGYAPWEPKLKRVPSPFDKDHAHGDLLRHKGLVVTGTPALTGDLVADLDAAFADLWPLSDMLIGVAETPTL
ncbi:TIGR02453 family protein [Octadecabacter temperatus]|uniref:Uncharacterized protein n=1 Tax=Octadecabacter temperatus TaxID=1458307 RepID=A0A0K0Y3M1_9RHOB|nr:DUF2461 domain-containing protein [Octadecabacter temperatus]AKS45539.1 hypothetical protein OSB_09810 [Octadecabacter temperatus]SIN95208.1 TIGR02453 family protein [Octadecabacter temperatus]